MKKEKNIEEAKKWDKIGADKGDYDSSERMKKL